MIEFTTSSENFPSVVGDEFADPLTQFKSTYQDDEISWSVTFSVPTDAETSEVFTVESVTVTDKNDGIEFSGSGDTLSAIGKVIDVFDGETFSFVLRDKSLLTTTKGELGSNQETIDRTNIDWASIVEWKQPPIKKDSIFYTFEITYIGDLTQIEVTESITIEQLVYWKLEPSLEYFQSLVPEGDY